MGCGQRVKKHALSHNQAHSHPLCLEINTQMCHCYVCESWVTQDTLNGDLALVREFLSEVQNHSFEASRTRRGTIIHAAQSIPQGRSAKDVREVSKGDMYYTAVAFRQQRLLRMFFTLWRTKTQEAIKNKPPPPPPLSPAAVGGSEARSKKRRLPDVASPNDLLLAYNQGLGRTVMRTKAEQEELVLTGYLGKRHNEWSGKTGLRNLGNSCYVNAVVQALRSVNVFNEFFLRTLAQSTPKEEDEKKEEEVFNLEGSVSLTEEVSNLFRIIQSGHWAAVTPYKLILAIWRLVPAFRSYKQQDAQEFFSFFLDRLEVELSEKKGPRMKSFIRDTFESHVVSQITCGKCGTMSSYKHPGSKYVLLDLSSTLTKQAQHNPEMVDLRRAKLTCSIVDCLADLTSPVSLVGSSKYKCQSCKSLQNATKRDVIVALPKVLVFFVNRTHWGNHGKCKLDTFMDFPISGLDMAPYCSLRRKTKQPLIYNLSAAVLHHGVNVDQGHYTAQCFNAATDSWMHFNDLKVLMTDSNHVKKMKGYLLFYERAAPPAHESKSKHQRCS